MRLAPREIEKIRLHNVRGTHSPACCCSRTVKEPLCPCPAASRFCCGAAAARSRAESNTWMKEVNSIGPCLCGRLQEISCELLGELAGARSCSRLCALKMETGLVMFAQHAGLHSSRCALLHFPPTKPRCLF